MKRKRKPFSLDSVPQKDVAMAALLKELDKLMDENKTLRQQRTEAVAKELWLRRENGELHRENDRLRRVELGMQEVAHG